MIDSMKAFRMVVEKGGFRAAASELDISPGMVSRHINKLEFQLKTQLIKRNTRSITLTDSGSLFFQHSVDILNAYDQCLHQVTSVGTNVSGNLKVGIPHSISQLHIIPALDKFYESQPDITLDIISGNHSLELFSHSYDLALHCGPLPDSNLYYTLLGYWGKHTCISPGYAHKHGIPSHPSELKNHNCLLHFDNRAKSWKYVIDRAITEISVSGDARINNSLDLYQMALNDLGVIYLPDFTVCNALSENQLMSILDDYMPPPLPMYVVHINPVPSKKEQIFIDFLKELPLAQVQAVDRYIK